MDTVSSPATTNFAYVAITVVVIVVALGAAFFIVRRNKSGRNQPTTSDSILSMNRAGSCVVQDNLRDEDGFEATIEDINVI